MILENITLNWQNKTQLKENGTPGPGEVLV